MPSSRCRRLGSPRGCGDTPPELEDDEVVTAREFTSRVYPDQPAGYDSNEEWWAKFARPYSEEHEAIEQLDSSARWGGVCEPGPAPTDDG